jgi:hypothetical protein
MHWFTAISCPGIPTNAVSCPASGCSEGQCCLGGAGYGLSPDGTSCGFCPAGSYKSITGTGKCLPCAERAGSEEGWTACMPGAVTWKLGSKGDSCDTTCSAAKDVGPCVEEAFKAEWSGDLMKKALVEPSKVLGSESVLDCSNGFGAETAASAPYRIISGLNNGRCAYPPNGGINSTCAAQPRTTIRRMCPCGCPFGTTASAGTTGPCRM